MYIISSMKSQSSVEFMIIFILLIIILSLAAWIGTTKTQQINTIQTNLEIGNLLNDVVNKIDTVFIEGSGFSTDITLPEKILGANYSITIINNQILVDHRNLVYSKRLLTDNITGNLSIGFNLITNENGVVVIS